MEENIFYHVSAKNYDSGNKIEIGRWGYTTLELGSRTSPWHNEMALEYIRGLYFPYKPSRLISSFAFYSLQKAQEFRNDPKQNRVNQTIYKVKIEDPSLPYHLGNFNIVFGYNHSREQTYLQQIAQIYWANADNESKDNNEIVTLSQLVVITKTPQEKEQENISTC